MCASPRSEEHTSVLQSPRRPLFPYTTLFRSYALGRIRGIDQPADSEPRKPAAAAGREAAAKCAPHQDRKSTRLYSSHLDVHSFPTRRSSDLTLWGVFEDSINRLIQNRENQRLLPGVKLPRNVRLTANDAECFDGATLVLSAVPTQYMRSVWKRLSNFIPAGVSIISVAKGIENQTLFRPTQIISDVVGRGRKLAALSGPNIAAELARYLPATAVAAAEDHEFARRIQAAFSTQWFS